MRFIVKAAAAVAVLVLAGCGGPAATRPASPASPSGYAAGAANPVPILKLTG
jgi:hypothetical protein